MRSILIIIFICFSNFLFAQDDLLSLVDSSSPMQKTYVKNAFKSSRVINGHSIEFIGKGVMDVRILHRFGSVKNGIKDLFGFDYANMRMGFDFGLGKDLTIGVGRSNVGKELDGFVKYRVIQQSTGAKHSSPVSVVVVTGITAGTAPLDNPVLNKSVSNKLGYYHEIIIGRKFNNQFSMQVAPTLVHRNLVPLNADKNDIIALGVGARMKLTRRTAFVVDYHYLFGDLNRTFNKNPLSLGFDIETGGHVFQLHFSNSTGMNEKAFITNTTKSWGSGEIRFGFNLSRVFTVSRKK